MADFLNQQERKEILHRVVQEGIRGLSENPEEDINQSKPGVGDFNNAADRTRPESNSSKVAPEVVPEKAVVTERKPPAEQVIYIKSLTDSYIEARNQTRNMHMGGDLATTRVKENAHIHAGKLLDMAVNIAASFTELTRRNPDVKYADEVMEYILPKMHADYRLDKHIIDAINRAYEEQYKKTSALEAAPAVEPRGSEIAQTTPAQTTRRSTEDLQAPKISNDIGTKRSPTEEIIMESAPDLELGGTITNTTSSVENAGNAVNQTPLQKQEHDEQLQKPSPTETIYQPGNPAGPRMGVDKPIDINETALGTMLGEKIEVSPTDNASAKEGRSREAVGPVATGQIEPVTEEKQPITPDHVEAEQTTEAPVPQIIGASQTESASPVVSSNTVIGRDGPEEQKPQLRVVSDVPAQQNEKPPGNILDAIRNLFNSKEPTTVDVSRAIAARDAEEKLPKAA